MTGDGERKAATRGVTVGGRNMPAFFYRELAWAWIIIVGGLMITPRGVECIACGRPLTVILGLISVAIGVTGFVAGRRAPVLAPTRQ